MSDVITKTDSIAKVSRWISDVVIELNFCPFAKNVVDKGQVRFVETDSRGQKEQLQVLINECLYLDDHPEVETTLLIFSKGLKDFDSFLYMAEMADELLAMQGYEGVYQLATFHPDYVFAGSNEDDAANFTNRSPLPVFHLIREESLEKVLAQYPTPENIPDINVKKARDFGPMFFRRILSNINNK